MAIVLLGAAAGFLTGLVTGFYLFPIYAALRTR